ncbi:MAG TPA: hypothetical protein VHA37_04155, partial [Candidatus Saccharimonadales bacterium]|nr:hypothetical protein [Candidatus Saccharimonadales bacterium]
MTGLKRALSKPAGVPHGASAKLRGDIKSTIRLWCMRQPDAPALVSSLRPPLLYRDLRSEIDAFGRALESLGLG